jgi:hypothetical protein
MGRAEKVFRSLDRKMSVRCRKCRERSSIIAMKPNFLLIYALLVLAYTKNLLENFQSANFLICPEWETGHAISIAWPNQSTFWPIWDLGDNCIWENIGSAHDSASIS